MRESELLSHLRLQATRLGHRLFRNNCGKYQDLMGRWIAYGVGSPGGADLIGWTRVTITPEMVGQTMAVFTAIEAKTGNTKTTQDQVRFLLAVQEAGGRAGVVRSVKDLGEVIG